MIHPFVAARHAASGKLAPAYSRSPSVIQTEAPPIQASIRSKSTALSSNERLKQWTQSIRQDLEKLADFITPTSRAALQKAVKAQADKLHEGGHRQQQLMIRMAELIAESPGTTVLKSPEIVALNQQTIQQLKQQEMRLKKALRLTDKLLKKIPSYDVRAREKYQHLQRLDQATLQHIQTDIGQPEQFLMNLAESVHGLSNGFSPSAARVQEEQTAFAQLIGKPLPTPKHSTSNK